MIRWDATPEEYLKIKEIVERATIINRDPVSLTMDITATHCNGCKLDLDKLLAAPDFDFYHDLSGIVEYLNRNTGKLQECFFPRCAL